MKANAEVRVNFLSAEFDRLNEVEALDAIRGLSRGSAFTYVVTPNVDHIVGLNAPTASDELRQSYALAELCLCDSRVLKILASLSGLSLDVVTGSDLTARLLRTENPVPNSLAIIGGEPDLLERLSLRYPQWRWKQHIPPMGVRDDLHAQSQIIEFVERSSAKIFLFAIGAPQSELLCSRIAARNCASGVGLCIGASLEFLTGSKARAPQWMQKFALEWLFRLASEPKRLGRRYLIEGPRIFLIWRSWRLNHARPVGVFGSTRHDET